MERGDTLRSRAAWASSRPARVGLRGARCTGAGEGPPVCIRWFQEARPEPSRGQNLGCRGGAPKGERARSMRSRLYEVLGLGPPTRGKGERTRAASLFDADPGGCACRRSASLLFEGRSFLDDAFWLGFSLFFLGVGKARVRSGIARTKNSSSPGLTLGSSPPGLTRWSMPNGRVQFGPTSVLRSSMDHRVKPGGDEEGATPR